ncbi:MAG: mevalonate kinase [Gemmatimonadota bacterium]
MGEHAAVYGHPALVTSVDLRLRVRFSARTGQGSGEAGSAGHRPSPGSSSEAPRLRGPVQIRLPQMHHSERLSWEELTAYAEAAGQRWRRFAADPDPGRFDRVRGGDPAHVVKVALGEAAAYLEETARPALRLEVDSDLPIGSGFGSSAALAVAVVGGYLMWRRGTASIEVIERLALEVERRQHGLPSGIDGATVLRGGVVWAERSEADRLRVRPLDEKVSLYGFRVFHTGTPAESTGAVVASVRERLERDRRVRATLDELGRTTRAFREALVTRDAEGVAASVRGFEAGLERIGVVPRRLQAIIRRVEAEGGAAKVSGAGTLSSPPTGPPGAGCLLVFHTDPTRIAGWSFLEGLRPYPVTLGGEGFRREQDE